MSPEQRDIYFDSSQQNAMRLQDDYDVVVVHDPQPAGLLPLRGKGDARWIRRCHIDTSEPNPEVWAFLRPLLAEYDAAIFTMTEFVPRTCRSIGSRSCPRPSTRSVPRISR